MTAKDQAIARFNQSLIHINRSLAPQPPTPDCRTCEYRDHCKDGVDMGCTNGDQYQPAPKVVLWKQNDN